MSHWCLLSFFFSFVIKGAENSSTPLDRIILAFTDIDRWSSLLRWQTVTSYSVHHTPLRHKNLILHLPFNYSKRKHPHMRSHPVYGCGLLWLVSVHSGSVHLINGCVNYEWVKMRGSRCLLKPATALKMHGLTVQLCVYAACSKTVCFSFFL